LGPILAGTLVGVALCMIIASAMAASPQRESLVGLRAIAVRVEYQGDIPAAWPDTAALASRLTLRLHESGVAVGSREQVARDPGAPLLLVRLDAIRPTAHGDQAITSFACDVQLEQDVRLARPRAAGAIRRAVTWSEHQVALESPEAGREELFETLEEQIDAFAHDWLAMHPRSHVVPQ
jgi:hypothetical protein